MTEHRFSEETYKKAGALKASIISLKEEIDNKPDSEKTQYLFSSIASIFLSLRLYGPKRKNILHLENFINKIFLKDINGINTRLKVNHYNYETGEIDYNVIISKEIQGSNTYDYKEVVLNNKQTPYTSKIVDDSNKLLENSRLSMYILIPSTKAVMSVISGTYNRDQFTGIPE